MTFHFFASTAFAIAIASSGSTAFAHGADGSGGTHLLVQGGQLGKTVFPDGNTAHGGQGQPVDGIEGSSQEMLKTHFHAHLAIFYKGEQVALPRGIGIIAPLRIDRGFVSGGKGFYWLHTHDASGILHVESPNDRVYTLGNFFDVWGQPLAADNVAGLNSALQVYVNGKVQCTPVRDLPLKPHDQIALVIGQPVAMPVTYKFPEGL